MIRIGLAGALFVAGVALAGTPTAALATTGGDEFTVQPCAQYVKEGTRTTLCADFPGPDDRNCRRDHIPPVAVIGKDIWELDSDGDGHGCEKPVSTPPTTPPTTRPTTTAPTATPTS